MPARGGRRDDGVGPVVVRHESVHHREALGRREPAIRQQQPEAREHPPGARVRDVGVGGERHPGPGRGGEVPDGAARAGQVEVDERGGPAAAEHDVGRVHVVVADQPSPEARRDGRARPPVPGRVERGGRAVVRAQERGHADQGVIGQKLKGKRRDGGSAGHVGEGFQVPRNRENSRGPAEPGGAQVGEQCVGAFPARGQRPHHRVPDPQHASPVRGPAGQDQPGPGRSPSRSTGRSPGGVRGEPGRRRAPG